MIGFLFVFACLIAAASGGYFYWAKRVRGQIAEGAKIAFQRYQDKEPAFVDGITLTEFEAAYHKAKFPRFPKYFLVAMALFAVALPAVFGVLSGIIWIGEQAGMIAEPAELAKYVPIGEAQTTIGQAEREEVALYLAKDFAGFYYFFGVIFAWMGIVTLVMRRYHQRRPGDVREEVIRVREAKSEG